MAYRFDATKARCPPPAGTLKLRQFKDHVASLHERLEMVDFAYLSHYSKAQVATSSLPTVHVGINGNL